MDKFKDFYSEWLNAQKQMMKSWMDASESLRPSSQDKRDQETSGAQANWYNQWQEAQLNFFKEWAESVANAQKAFTGLGGIGTPQPEAMRRASQLHESWMGIYSLWAGSMSKAFEDMMAGLSEGIGKKTFANISSSADTYMKLFEFWLPIYESLQEKSFDPAAYQRFIDPAKYQEVLEKVFDFISPGTVKEFYEQAMSYLETVTPLARSFAQQAADVTQRNVRQFSGMLAGDPEAARATYDNLLDVYRQTLSPMLKLPAMSRHRERVELVLKLLGNYPAYAAQYASFQKLVYTTGQSAMENVMKQVAQRLKEKSTPPGYDDFFKVWAEANEQAYSELFNTEKFSELQSQLQKSGLEMKKDFEKLMELSLKEYPVVLRSEMDELYKTMHDLRRRLYDLEKEMSARAAKGANQ